MTAQQLTEQVVALPPEARQHAEEFVAFLSQKYAPLAQPTATRVQGISGRELLRFAGAIEADDLKLMSAAIEEGCEQVDHHEW